MSSVKPQKHSSTGLWPAVHPHGVSPSRAADTEPRLTCMGALKQCPESSPAPSVLAMGKGGEAPEEPLIAC